MGDTMSFEEMRSVAKRMRGVYEAWGQAERIFDEAARIAAETATAERKLQQLHDDSAALIGAVAKLRAEAEAADRESLDRKAAAEAQAAEAERAANARVAKAKAGADAAVRDIEAAVNSARASASEEHKALAADIDDLKARRDSAQAELDALRERLSKVG